MWLTSPGAGAREPHELALARLEREGQPGARRERGAPRAGCDHDGPALDGLAAGRAHAAAEDRLDRAPLADRRPGRSGLARQRPRDRPRVALEVVGEQARAVQRAGQLGLELAHRVRAEQPRPRDPASAPAAPARPPRSRRPGARSGLPCAGSAPRRRAAAPARRRAPGLRAPAPARVPRPCRSTARCPRPGRWRRWTPCPGPAASRRRRGPPARARPRCRRSRRRRRRRRSQREARRERVLGVEQVLAHRGDPGAAGDLRHDRGPARDAGLLRRPGR